MSGLEAAALFGVPAAAVSAWLVWLDWRHPYQRATRAMHRQRRVLVKLGADSTQAAAAFAELKDALAALDWSAWERWNRERPWER